MWLASTYMNNLFVYNKNKDARTLLQIVGAYTKIKN